MIFPFTFKFPVPGIINPFASSSPNKAPQATVTARESESGVGVRNQTDKKQIGSKILLPPPLLQLPQPQPHTQTPTTTSGRLRSPSITPPVIISRKRGWEPAFGAEPIQSPTRANPMENAMDNAVGGEPGEYHEVVDALDGEDADAPARLSLMLNVEFPPPSKRRRGLAGSIVSTALSAALIGTAVGLTVFRLWRDRGKSTSTQPSSSSTKPASPTDANSPALPPPPPYQETERSTPSATPTTPCKARKHRGPHTHAHTSSSRRSHHPASFTRQRSFRTRPAPLFMTSTESDFTPSHTTAGSSSSNTQPEGVDDQMDWIGDKLSALIAQGKRALGTEIVVMSDAKEDEVDDGMGVWADEDEDRNPKRRAASPGSVSSRRRSRSQRRSPRKADAAFNTPPRHVYSASTSCLPSQPLLSYPAPMTSYVSTHASTPTTPRKTHNSRANGLSLDSSSSPGASRWTGSEDVDSFDSPELRETMERARQRVLMRAAANGTRGPEL